MPVSAQYFKVVADVCGEPLGSGLPAIEGFEAWHVEFPIAPYVAGYDISPLIMVKCDIFLAAQNNSGKNDQIPFCPPGLEN